MPNLIFFYVSDGACNDDANVTWDYMGITNNRYAQNVWQEGVFQLWDKMASSKVVSQAITYIDSMRGRHGNIRMTPNSVVCCVPHLKYALSEIKADDIIIARGGFKPWFPVLAELQKRGNWILFYRANTNRGPWPFWDVVLDDLISQHEIHDGRLYFSFNKPVNESLFFPKKEITKLYDVMLNASHIHEKKGQHIFIHAAVDYQEKYDQNIKICMPGGFVKSWVREYILQTIQKYGLDVTIPGGVHRKDLNTLYNASKIYVHLGTGGQNDRGCLEAMRVGLPVFIKNIRAFAPFVSKCNLYTEKVLEGLPSIGIAESFKHMLNEYNDLESPLYKDASDYYLKSNGLWEVALPRMATLFENLYSIGQPNRAEICKRYL